MVADRDGADHQRVARGRSTNTSRGGGESKTFHGSALHSERKAAKRREGVRVRFVSGVVRVVRKMSSCACSCVHVDVRLATDIAFRWRLNCYVAFHSMRTFDAFPRIEDFYVIE